MRQLRAILLGMLLLSAVVLFIAAETLALKIRERTDPQVLEQANGYVKIDLSGRVINYFAAKIGFLDEKNSVELFRYKKYRPDELQCKVVDIIQPAVVDPYDEYMRELLVLRGVLDREQYTHADHVAAMGRLIWTAKAYPDREFAQDINYFLKVSSFLEQMRNENWDGAWQTTCDIEEMLVNREGAELDKYLYDIIRTSSGPELGLLIEVPFQHVVAYLRAKLGAQTSNKQLVLDMLYGLQDEMIALRGQNKPLINDFYQLLIMACDGSKDDADYFKVLNAAMDQGLNQTSLTLEYRTP